MESQKHSSTLKLLVTVEEAAHILSMGRSSFYQLVMRKKIFSVKVGRKRLIPFIALEKFVTQQMEEQGA